MIKKILILCLIILGIIVIIFFLKKSEWNGKGDFKIGIIGNDKIGIVSISPERKMINSLEINGEVLVWIPGGLGWYRSDRVRKLFEQEKVKEKEVNEMFFYNLGFLPDRVIYVDNFGDWRKESVQLTKFDVMSWLRIKGLNDEIIYKNEINKEKLFDDNLLLNEIMARDFVDSRLVSDELKLSVINTTKEEQFANFMAKRLEWFGFAVISVDNSEKKVEKCLMLIGPKSEESLGFKKLDFLDCEKQKDKGLNENEVELYFGDKYTKMLKYSTYVGTF